MWVKQRFFLRGYEIMHGCQKRMYCIKNVGGLYFEEVYFVLKRTAPDAQSQIAGRDLATEAERIVREASAALPCRPRRTPLIGRAAAFALGAASSSAVIGAVALILGTV